MFLEIVDQIFPVKRWPIKWISRAELSLFSFIFERKWRKREHAVLEASTRVLAR